MVLVKKSIAAAQMPAGKPPLERSTRPHGAPENRSFPRGTIRVPFRLWVAEGDELRFEATLRSGNVSVSGAFIESTFFLPEGTRLRASFVLAPEQAPVLALTEVVRVDAGGRDGGSSGFAVRFLEFFEQTEITLARLFWGEDLQAFAEEYLASRRARLVKSELDRCVDVLAAWELRKVSATGDAWTGESV